MKSSILLITAILSYCLPALAQSASDEQLVIGASPSAVRANGTMLYDFSRADLDRTGNGDYIVAVYCGSPNGIIRVLRPSGNDAAVVAETGYPAMGGHFPRLRLVDLDGDGSPEIVASFATMGGLEQTWIFRWSGAALALFGPTTTSGRRSVVHSLISSVDFLDVDGDGIPEIIEVDHNRSRILRRRPDGGYAPDDNTVVYFNRYERHETDPELYTGIFRAKRGQILEVKMVFPAGQTPPTQGDLYINGSLVFDIAALSAHGQVLTRNVTAEDLNEVESLLDGHVGSAVNVIITVSGQGIGQ
jgi:hypothetical protein